MWIHSGNGFASVKSQGSLCREVVKISVSAEPRSTNGHEGGNFDKRPLNSLFHREDTVFEPRCLRFLRPAQRNEFSKSEVAKNVCKIALLGYLFPPLFTREVLP